MEFHKQLHRLRMERHMTQEELSEAVCTSLTTISCWERGVATPNMRAILALTNVFGVSADTLLGIPDYGGSITPAEKRLLEQYQALDSHGKTVVETVCALEKQRMDTEAAQRIRPAKTSAMAHERYIPHYTTPSAAGYNVPLDEAEFEMLPIDDAVPPDADYAVNIQGNSMYPYIRDGEMVDVKKDEPLSVGDIGIFSVDGAMYCKQYYVDASGTLMLLSANPDLRASNIVVSPDSGISVIPCGKVLLGKHVALPDYIWEE